jgi:UDP-2,3-diacylglucosamine pyrophosphatase LpxH
MKTICVSDLHLGSEVCQHKKIKNFLYDIFNEEIKLILNGDVFDHHKIKTFSRKDFEILFILEKMSKEKEVIWIKGNHDKLFHEKVLESTKKCENYFIENGIIYIHGDKFDTLLNRYKALEQLGDFIYSNLQKIDPTHKIPRYLKRISKHCLNVRNTVKIGALDFLKQNGCSKIICGHTHYHVEDDPYYNCGCWTEKPCTFAVIQDNEVKIKDYS